MFRQLIITILLSGSFMAAPERMNAGEPEIVPVKIGIISDIHPDIMFDGEQRLADFLSSARREKVDFVIQLGDFCNPTAANEAFRNLWSNFPLEKHSVLGNHDMDKCSKEEFLEFVGGKARYYAFDKGNFRFIILDPNNLNKDGRYIPYRKGNYYVNPSMRAFVDPEQMEWLRHQVEEAPGYCVCFSHQSLEYEGACKNGAEIRAIFEEANRKAGYKKVIAAFSGHNHTSYVKKINGINYVQINSASNYWIGEQYKCPERFPEEINRKYPALQYTFPYQESVFAFITLNRRGLKIKGTKTRFISPGPDELGVAEQKLPIVPFNVDYRDRCFRK